MVNSLFYFQILVMTRETGGKDGGNADREAFYSCFLNPTFNVKFKIQSPEIDLLITPVKAQGDGAFLRD